MKRMRTTALALVLTLVFQMSGGLVPASALTPTGDAAKAWAAHTGQLKTLITPKFSTKPDEKNQQLPPSTYENTESNDTTAPMPPVNPVDPNIPLPPEEAVDPNGAAHPSIGPVDPNMQLPPEEVVDPDGTKPPSIKPEDPNTQIPPGQVGDPSSQLLPLIEPVPGKPMEIDSAKALETLKTSSAGSYVLIKDIDLKGAGWTSIDFSGTLDSAGHTITLDGAPLFKSLSGTVTNLVLAGQVTIAKDVEAGSLALTLTSKGRIRNCATAVAVTTTDDDDSDVGGLVGTLEGGFIENCVVTGTFQNDGWNDSYGAAASAESGTVQHCYWSDDKIRKAIGGWGGITPTKCDKKSETDMKSTGFLTLLNRNLGEGDLSWGLAAENGLPVPDGKFPGKKVDKAALQMAVDDVKDLSNGSDKPYTSDSWEEFDKARTAAESILKDETATQSQVNTAAKKLSDAQQGLTFLKLDAIKKAVEAGGEISNVGDKGDKYTPESWKTLQDALTAAKGILADLAEEGATQRQIDSKTAALQKAISGLKEDLSGKVKRVALIAAIEATSSVVNSNKIYTKVSMAAFQMALKNANAVNADKAADQRAIDGAAKELSDAQAGLSERSVSMVNMPSDAIHITQPEQLLHLEDGKYYVLDHDMELYIDEPHSFGDKTLIERKWDGPSMSCVLDGQGHTLTLLNGEDNPKGQGTMYSKISSKAVFTSIGPDGVVQNLGVVGKTVGFGSIASECQGLIANCWARIDLRPPYYFGGLVGKLDSGGVLLNSYAIAKAGVGGSNVGPANSGDSNSLIQNCYWLGAKAAVASGTPKIPGSTVKTEEDFTSADGVVKLLNTNRGDLGKEWHRDSKGYPYFGEEKEFQPPQILNITLTLQDGTKKTFSSENGLTLSVFDADGAGNFGTLFCATHPEKVSWKDVSGFTASDFRPISISSTGRLSLLDGPGSTKIGLFDEEGHELARFPLTVDTTGTVTDTKLILSKIINDEQNYTKLEPQNGVCTVAGRIILKAEMEVKLEGKDGYQSVYPGLFNYESDDPKVLSYAYSNYLNTKNPGSANLTIAAKDPLTHMIRQQTAKITSTYVPVTSVSMDIENSYVLHDRTAPTTEAPGTFVPISMNNPDFKPNNASYQDDASNQDYGWTITSSDPSVAKYLTTMVYGFVADKAGTTTFTASTKDPGKTPVTFSKTVTFTYKNPVKSVTMKDDQKEFTVATGKTLELPLVWKGQNDSPEHPCHVTEANMTWKTEGSGEVKLNRNGDSVGSDYPGEKWVSNPVWRVIGTKEGDVTVTGTPADQTQNAKPVTFTVHVVAGGPHEPVDYNGLVQKGITGAQGFLSQKTTSYDFGKEWEVFSLMRSGGSIPTAEVEKYLNSVAETYTNPSDTNLKPTTIARTAVALGALNEDVSNFRGIDLIGMLCSSNKIKDGSNESIWALIALDTHQYKVPQGALWDRDKLITEILRYQNTSNGGFGLTDNQTTGVDMTAMALQALAPYQQRPNVGSAISRALEYLHKAQGIDGGFKNLESAAQVLTALSTLKMDPLDEKNGFVQPAGDIITNIMAFYDKDSGGFFHASGSAAEPMSSVQALYSLEAYQRYKSGENRLYDLTDADPRAVLAKRLAEAEKLVEKDYTPETWSILAQAKAVAKAVLDQTDATAEKLTTAGGNLANAISGLKRVDGQSGVLPQPEGSIKVTFRLVGAELSSHGNVDLGAGTDNAPYKTWISTTNYTVNASSTMYDLFTQALNGAGLRSVGADKNYVRTVYAPEGYGGYPLSEFTNGKYSGWMYTVNGKHPDVGLQYYKLKDGDKVVWHYVNDYRYEVEDWYGGSLGNPSTWNGWMNVPDINPPTKPVVPILPGAGDGTVNLKPQVSAVVNGESKVQLTTEDISKAVEQVKKGDAASIVIEPQVQGSPSKITVTLPKGSVAEIAGQTSAGLVMKTAVANISIPNKTLDALILEKGETVSIFTETIKDQGGKANGQIAIGIQVDGKIKEKISGGIAVSIPTEQPVAGDVLVQVTDQGTKIIRKSAVDGQNINALLDGSATVMIQDNDKSFQDVPEGYWGKDAVSFAVSHQLFYGTEENTFDPSADMTRSMLVTVLWRLDGEEAPKETSSFHDVNGGWYAQAVQWAAESGIVHGDGSSFHPDGDVTREELAAMLYRYMEHDGQDMKKQEDKKGKETGNHDTKEQANQDSEKPDSKKLSPENQDSKKPDSKKLSSENQDDKKQGSEQQDSKAKSGLAQFSDENQLAPWAKDAMKWAVDAGLISGKENGTLDPNGLATRAEVAAVLQRSVSYMLK